MKKHFNIKIYGLVQGVFFRATTKEQANKLEITGFARNNMDGAVYVEAEGEEINLEKFIKWCHQGPTFAKVDKVDIKEDLMKNFLTFEVY